MPASNRVLRVLCLLLGSLAVVATAAAVWAFTRGEQLRTRLDEVTRPPVTPPDVAPPGTENQGPKSGLEILGEDLHTGLPRPNKEVTTLRQWKLAAEGVTKITVRLLVSIDGTTTEHNTVYTWGPPLPKSEFRLVYLDEEQYGVKGTPLRAVWLVGGPVKGQSWGGGSGVLSPRRITFEDERRFGPSIRAIQYSSDLKGPVERGKPGLVGWNIFWAKGAAAANPSGIVDGILAEPKQRLVENTDASGKALVELNKVTIILVEWE